METKNPPKFCSQCGNKLPSNAAFCPNCGTKIGGSPASADSQATAAAQDKDREMSVNNKKDVALTMKLLVYLLWGGVGTSILSLLVGTFDIRECYDDGRIGYFILTGGGVALDAWLAFAISRGKNWARVSSVALLVFAWMIIVLAGGPSVFLTREATAVVFLDSVSSVVEIVCAILCLTKPVRSFCKKEILSDSMRSANRYLCALFWFCSIAWYIASGVYTSMRVGSGQWIEDCKAAAIEGSMSAREALIDKLTEEYSDGFSDDEEIEGARDKAASEIDQFIKENKTSRQVRDGKVTAATLLGIKGVAKEGGGNVGCMGVATNTGETKTLTLPGGAMMEMIYVAPGSFMMGRSPSEDCEDDDDEQQHRVMLTKGFWLGKYEVTQLQWQSVMGNNPSNFKGDDRPVEKVSWDDCQRFIKKVNAQLNCGARLPTEAEWEYACRAGTTTAYSWGNALNGDKANCHGNYPCGTTVKGPYRKETAPVGSYSANAWGFFDMHGNVWEWCNDWYGAYPAPRYRGVKRDPPGPASGSGRVMRGGSWDSNAKYCRSAERRMRQPGDRDNRYGFRLCCSALP